MKRKTNALVRVCVWTAVTMILVVTLLVGTGLSSGLKPLRNAWGESSTSYSYENADEYTIGDVPVRVTGIDNLDINWVSGSTTIERYDGDKIVFSETASRTLADHERMRYRVHGDTLTIEFCESQRGIFSTVSMPSKSLTVRLPYSLSLDTLDLESVSSQVTVRGEGLAVDAVEIDNVSGHVVLDGIRADVLNVDSVSGHLQIGGAYDVVRVNSVSGAQDFRLGQTPTELRVDCVSGTTTVYLPGERGFTASLDSLSGALTSDFADVTGRDEARYGDGEANLRFDSISGSVSLRLDRTLTAPQAPSRARAEEAASPAPTGKQDEPIPSSQRGF